MPGARQVGAIDFDALSAAFLACGWEYEQGSGTSHNKFRNPETGAVYVLSRNIGDPRAWKNILSQVKRLDGGQAVYDHLATPRKVRPRRRATSPDTSNTPELQDLNALLDAGRNGAAKAGAGLGFQLKEHTVAQQPQYQRLPELQEQIDLLQIEVTELKTNQRFVRTILDRVQHETEQAAKDALIRLAKELLP